MAENRRLNQIWHNMIYRCYSKKLKPETARVYRDRGITVCDEWLTSYATFRDWALSHGYSDDLTIDRIDPDGNYEPENCRWLTKSENSKMARHSRRYANKEQYILGDNFMDKQEIESMVNLLKSMSADEQKFVYGVILGVSGNLAGVPGERTRPVKEYAVRYGKAPQQELSPPLLPPPVPESSGTFDLCVTDGEETLRFEGVDVEEAVRHFRGFLEGEVVPNGGRAVLVSCIEFRKT